MQVEYEYVFKKGQLDPPPLAFLSSSKMSIFNTYPYFVCCIDVWVGSISISIRSRDFDSHSTVHISCRPAHMSRVLNFDVRVLSSLMRSAINRFAIVILRYPSDSEYPSASGDVEVIERKSKVSAVSATMLDRIVANPMLYSSSNAGAKSSKKNYDV